MRLLLVGLLGLALLAPASFAFDSITMPRSEDAGEATWVLDATPDGSKVYVVELPPLEDTAEGSVHVFDANTLALCCVIPLGPGFPFGITHTPDGSRMLVSISKAAGPGVTPGENRVVVIDTTTDTVSDEVELLGGSAYGAYGIAVDGTGAKAYVPDRGTDLVWVVDLATLSVSGTIPLSGGGTSAKTLPGGQRILVASNSTTADFVLIDTATDSIVGVATSNLAVSDYYGIAATPDGSRVYVTGILDSAVCVIDTDPASAFFLHQTARIETAAFRLAYAEMHSSGSRLLISSPFDGGVLVVNTVPGGPNFHRVTAIATTNDAPIGLAVLPGHVGRVFSSSFFGGVSTFRIRPD